MTATFLNNKGVLILSSAAAAAGHTRERVSLFTEHAQDERSLYVACFYAWGAEGNA